MNDFYSSRIYPCPILFCIGSYPRAVRSFFLKEEICTRMELLKLFTLPSQRCSIISSADDPVAVKQKIFQKCAFFPGESQRRAIYTGFSCTCVKGNAAASQADILLDKFASGKAADAGFQLFEMKWLGEVIVGSQIQPFYLILDLYSCGEYENRSIGIEGTELTQDFQTVNSRRFRSRRIRS